MNLSKEDEHLLDKIYIGQRVREEGLVEESLNNKEKNLIPLLIQKGLIENSEWKYFKKYALYKTTEQGSKLASINIQNNLNSSNIALQIQKIPLLFLKLCFFNIDEFFQHEKEINLKDFYWEEGIKEFLIVKGLRYWKMLIEIFKEKNLCIESYYYVSTNRGELRDLYEILPELEIKLFLKNKLEITGGLPDNIIEQLQQTRQVMIKKREDIFFEGIIEDFSPKFAKVIQTAEKTPSPLFKNKKFLVFLSHATKDEARYGIKKIAELLTSYPDIKDARYWQEDMYDNIYVFMDENVRDCDVFILFCSPDALRSDAVIKEWTAADSLNKPIIPIYVKAEHIPPLLSSRLGLEFDMFNYQDFISKLHDLIIKKVKSIE